jgi:hypothetical protein
VRVDHPFRLISVLSKPVSRPFLSVAEHVEETKPIRLLLPDTMKSYTTILQTGFKSNLNL